MTPEQYSFFLAYGVQDDASLQDMEAEMLRMMHKDEDVIPLVQHLGIPG